MRPLPTTCSDGPARMLRDIKFRGVTAHQYRVVPAMIVPFEFHKLLPPGIGACQAQCDLHDLGAAVRVGDELGARDDPGETFGHFELQVVLRTEGEPEPCLLRDGLHDLTWRLPQDERSPRQAVVDVAVAIDVLHLTAVAVLEIEGIRARRAAQPTRHAAGQRFLSMTVARQGLWRPIPHALLALFDTDLRGGQHGSNYSLQE